MERTKAQLEQMTKTKEKVENKDGVTVETKEPEKEKTEEQIKR